MASTSGAPATVAGLAQGYSHLFGFAVPLREPIPAYGVGEGYIDSTAEDLARYTVAVMDGGAGSCPRRSRRWCWAGPRRR